MGIPCMNCKKDVASSDIKLFAECCVCQDCFRLAIRIYDQSQVELQQYAAAMRELIRTAIVQGRLSLPQAVQTNIAEQGKVPPTIHFISEMLKCPPHLQMQSKGISKQPAPVQDADGQQESGSTKEQSALESPSTAAPTTKDSEDARDANGTP